MKQLFAELMGKATGMSKGKAGSMHLSAPEQGVIGASAVVASTISHAVGSALASKIRGEHHRVFVANFGDGATEQGVFHESLNFAAIHNVPTLFLCEDNGLAVHTSVEQRQSYKLQSLVEAYNIPCLHLAEGFDPDRVFEVAGEAIGLIRTKQSPVFLHIQTARYKEHVGPGEDFDAGYRSEETIAGWKRKDPLCADTDEISRLRIEIMAEIESAVTFAINSPLPPAQELLTDVI